ncbi:hypothetical protein MBLNU459_g4011t1 [Dothideomycetes sp. NU459]
MAATQPDPSTIPSSEDATVAELAAAKLMRQNQRILENDLTVMLPTGVSKPKPAQRSRTNKTWKPFSLVLPEFNNERMSSANISRRISPFDVHAKEFRPSSQDGDLGDQSAGAQINVNSMAPRSTSAVQASDSDDSDFQLVTSKKTKSFSKPAVGLNAYEVKTEDKPLTVATTFNKKEINDVFGNDLPPPQYIQSICGSQHGQMQFVVHPNGDVSAHQWGSDKYQWTNIGHFSNVRKRREGMLASLRLKDESEEHTIQQNTLAYFRAVAKQLEANVMGRPWGAKEVQAAMPNVRVARMNSLPHKKAKSPESESSSETSSDAPTGNHFHPYMDKSCYGVNLLERYPNGISREELSRLQFGIYPPSSTYVPTDTSKGSFQSDSLLPFSSLSNINQAPRVSGDPSPALSRNNVSFGSFPAFKPREIADLRAQIPVPIAQIQPVQEDLWYNRELQESQQSMPKSLWMPSAPSVNAVYGKDEDKTGTGLVHQSPYNTFGSVKKQATPFTPQRSNLAQQDRRITKEYLEKISDAASARGMSNSIATPRTVLHDPLKDQSGAISYETPKHRSNSGWTPGGPTRSGTSIPVSTSGNDAAAPIASNRSPFVYRDTSKDLSNSEPEPGWKNRPVEIIDVSTPYMSHEQLAMYSKPTPQNWDGPFFTGSPDHPSTANKKSYDEELHDWFFNGNKVQRQDEFFERIKAAQNPTRPSSESKRGPGVIGRPSSTTKSMTNSDKFNEATTRLLIPVLETLSSYVEGPVEQRHGYFAQFTAPPEWCIDKSPSGNKSFFGEDWGQPPERIGRDARYGHGSFEGRFGGFSPQRPMSKGLVGLGRNASSLDGRFAFNSSPLKF